MSIKQFITGQWTTALMKYTWNDGMTLSFMNNELIMNKCECYESISMMNE